MAADPLSLPGQHEHHHHAISLRVISIGTLARHPLWGERNMMRTAHATTTLVTSDHRQILVDPSLPAPVLKARLFERAGIAHDAVTHVFLTSFRPDLRAGLDLFSQSMPVFISEQERETVGRTLIEHYRQARQEKDQDLLKHLAAEIDILERCKAAPDSLDEHVDLFPLPGVTPGLAGLLISHPGATTLICGDAIPTVEHLEAGHVLQESFNLDQARESFTEAVEIADYLVLGRDNFIPNPTRRPF